MPREPSYRKHSVENFGFYEYQKKRVRLPGEFNSPESLSAYYSFVAKWRASHGVLPPAVAPPDQITISDLCNRYLAYAEVHYEKGGKRGELQNAVAMVRYLVKHFAHEPAAKFGPRKLKELRDKMVGQTIVPRRSKKNPASPASHRPLKTLSRTYINSIVARVKRLFRWAASEELIPANLYLALETVPGLRGVGVFRPPRLLRRLRRHWRHPVRAPGATSDLRPADVDQ